MMKQYVFFFLTLVLVSCGVDVDDPKSVELPASNDKPVTEVVTPMPTPAEQTEEVVTNEVIDEVSSSEAMIDEEVSPVETKVEAEVPEMEVVKDEVLPSPPAVEPAVLKPDHTVWDQLLNQNVSRSGKVNYKGMKASSDAINTYITELSNLTDQSDWSRNEKLAYWINLYNAVTVQLIVRHYPVSSITKLHGGKPWDQKLVTIDGKGYSLNDIENKIIRPRFNDARIHFAVNCAAKSCPSLLNEAFIADRLSAQLNRQTKLFINGSGNDIAENKLVISKIFEWYKTDFKNGDLIGFINDYSQVQVNTEAELLFNEYDWALNE